MRTAFYPTCADMEVVKEKDNRIRVVCYLHRPFSNQIRVAEPGGGFVLGETLHARRFNIVNEEMSENHHSGTFDACRECKYFYQSGQRCTTEGIKRKEASQQYRVAG